jgi:hypothetical protein
MLENLDQNTLRQRLGFRADREDVPAVDSVAEAARTCIQSWRSPARARVTTYLHRQFIAAGFDEGLVRNRVTDVIDALIDIGEFTRIRLDGKDSLALSGPSIVSINDGSFIVLGKVAAPLPNDFHGPRYTRLTSSVPVALESVPFSDWIGPAGFHLHLARRVGGQADSTLREFWRCLADAVTHEGNPLDPVTMRAVVGSPDATVWFGRCDTPEVSGRWASTVPNGTWCGVRPGRAPNEWHPILATVEGSAAQALDLYNWDEWAWALLARGVVTETPENSNWRNGVLTFQHPIPTQFVRAMRLLGGPGPRAWTWQVSEAANQCFDNWRRSQS